MVLSADSDRRLETEIEKGNFREDLFYRLNVVHIAMPPLRNRKEDIPPLVNYFVKKYAEKYGKNVSGVSPSAMWSLINRPWRGNVRELENAIARSLAVAKETVIGEEDTLRERDDDWSIGFKQAKKQALLNFHRTYFTAALTKNSGNVSKTAEECAMTRQALQQILKRCGMNPDDFR